MENKIKLGPRELEIMNVLWTRGPSTVSDVRRAIRDEVAHNTVLTILRILLDKGFVGRREQGRAHVYHTRIERNDVRNGLLDRVVGMLFDGSPELMMSHLVRRGRVSDDEMRKIRALLDERLREGER